MCHTSSIRAVCGSHKYVKRRRDAQDAEDALLQTDTLFYVVVSLSVLSSGMKNVKTWTLHTVVTWSYPVWHQ